MVIENQYTKKKQEEFQRDVEIALAQGAEVELRAKDGVLRDKQGRKMYKVTACEVGMFGVYIDIAYSLLHAQLTRLLPIAEKYQIELVIMESLSEQRHWAIECRMTSDTIEVED